MINHPFPDAHIRGTSQQAKQWGQSPGKRKQSVKYDRLPSSKGEAMYVHEQTLPYYTTVHKPLKSGLTEVTTDTTDRN